MLMYNLILILPEHSLTKYFLDRDSYLYVRPGLSVYFRPCIHAFQQRLGWAAQFLDSWTLMRKRMKNRILSQQKTRVP